MEIDDDDIASNYSNATDDEFMQKYDDVMEIV